VAQFCGPTYTHSHTALHILGAPPNSVVHCESMLCSTVHQTGKMTMKTHSDLFVYCTVPCHESTSQQLLFDFLAIFHTGVETRVPITDEGAALSHNSRDPNVEFVLQC
jgi:hypothetical protein